jgi:hypothetical protein
MLCMRKEAKKKHTTKISLTKRTLRTIDEHTLEEVQGGISTLCDYSNSVRFSTNHNQALRHR